MGQFKSVTTKQINAIRNTPGAPVWQRNYYEHIIRSEKSLLNIQRYISGNPQRWAGMLRTGIIAKQIRS